jgi:transcriptional regulator with XRE-family HTH domain
VKALRLDDVLRDLGRRIADLRVRRGLTQDRLAENADVTVQYIQRIEAGRENLTVRSLVRLANLLGVSIVEIFEEPLPRPVKPGRPARKSDAPSGPRRRSNRPDPKPTAHPAPDDQATAISSHRGAPRPGDRRS